MCRKFCILFNHEERSFNFRNNNQMFYDIGINCFVTPLHIFTTKPQQIEISLFESSFQQETNFSSLFVPKYSLKINMNSKCNKKRPYKY